MDAYVELISGYTNLVKRWAVLPGVSAAAAAGDVSLIAVDPKSLARYHIEFDITRSLIDDGDKAVALRKLAASKFDRPEQIELLASIGINRNAYAKVLVARYTDKSVEDVALAEGLILWNWRAVVAELKPALRKRLSGLHTGLRTLQLFTFPPG